MPLYNTAMPPYKTGQKNSNETACETTDLDSRPLLKTNSSLLSKVSFCDEEVYPVHTMGSYKWIQTRRPKSGQSPPFVWCQCSPGCSSRISCILTKILQSVIVQIAMCAPVSNRPECPPPPNTNISDKFRPLRLRILGLGF